MDRTPTQPLKRRPEYDEISPSDLGMAVLCASALAIGIPIAVGSVLAGKEIDAATKRAESAAQYQPTQSAQTTGGIREEAYPETTSISPGPDADPIEIEPEAPSNPNATVDLSAYVTDLIVSKPYGTPDNFTGKVVYPASETELVEVCKMKAGSAEMLQEADEYLKKITDGYRLVAWDCYRPKEAQQMLWDTYGCNEDPSKCSGFIARPGGSNHQRRQAFDGTLADRHGNLLEMPTEYDDFRRMARPGSKALWTPDARENWEIYNAAMQAGGCQIIGSEWWHADCK